MSIKVHSCVVSLLALLCCSCSISKVNADLENGKANLSNSQVNISHLPSDDNMVKAYWEINNWKTGLYDINSVIHNEAELENYLGLPLSDLKEDADNGFVSVIENLSDDFFTNSDLIITKNITVPINFNIKFLDATLEEGKLSLNYLFNPESYPYQMYAAEENLVDLISVDKGTTISSINLNIEGLTE